MMVISSDCQSTAKTGFISGIRFLSFRTTKDKPSRVPHLHQFSRLSDNPVTVL